jgi:hypothetical protein
MVNQSIHFEYKNTNFISNLVQFEKQMKGVFSHNIEIEENINDINERLLKSYDKLRVLDNMIELASQSLRIYFDKVFVLSLSIFEMIFLIREWKVYALLLMNIVTSFNRSLAKKLNIGRKFML